MDVLCLVPRSRFSENVVRDVLYGCWCKGKRIGGATVPPLALLSVATVLKEDGHNVRLIDCPSEDKTLEDVKSVIGDYQAVVLLTSTMTFNEDAGFLSELKAVNGKLTSIIFGSHPTFMPRYCLRNKAIDIIVKKEPEFIIRDLLRGMESGRWKGVKGIGYREKGGVRINPDYPFIEDLNELPMCDRSLLPGVDYYNPIIKRLPYTTTVTSRGCPGLCRFCTVPAIYGKRLRYWSAERVVGEMEMLAGMGYREIYFRDETFSTFRNRNIEICNEIIRRKLDLPWICNVRVGTVDRETLFLMKRAGCHLIKVGVESGVQEILDKSRKGIKLEQVISLFRWAKEAGIDTHAHMMIGMPGESRETVEKTIGFLKRIRPTTIDVGICTPYPGSELFREVAKRHPEIRDGTRADLEKLHTTTFFNETYTDLDSREIEEALVRVYRSFYMRPGYFLRTVFRIRGWGDLRNFLTAGINVIRFAMKGD